jgi:hypothetical protein
MRRRHLALAALALLVAVAIPAAAISATVDPQLYFTVSKFKFNPTKGSKPGTLAFTPGSVVAVRYTDGSVVTAKTSFESIIGAKVKFSKLTESLTDPFTFLDGKVTIGAGKGLYINGSLTNITFDPGVNTTDGIVTLNLGFSLDNYWFTLLNQGLNSRFITEYANNSSTTAGAMALTLVSSSAPGKRIDGFNVHAEGPVSGQFQIPEPASLLLLASGLAGLAAARRRR